MVHFAQPQAFQLLWLLPALVFFVLFAQRRARTRLVKVFGVKLTPLLTASLSTSKRRLRLVLWCAALVFYVVALARPQLGKGATSIKSEGVEIMIALDVSNSMLAEDVKPSRLEYAKSEIGRLIDTLGGDKVGLIAFAGSATLLSPLTTDKSALHMFLDTITPLAVETQGTEFKKALDEAHSALEQGGADAEEGVKITRVVLLASDGEDNEPGAIDYAKKIAAEGVHIFTMAFGTERGAPIPERDERGYLRGYKKDRANKEVITQVHGDMLKQLAEVGQGAFYHATFGGGESKLMRADLDKLKKTQFASEQATNFDEKYQLFLILGLLCSLAELALHERRAKGRLWRGRFEVPQS
jgi:Ca-activated chloride channel family protein